MRTLIVIAALSTVTLTMQQPAESCGNAVRAQIHEQVRAISHAEKLNRRGEYHKAMKTIVRAMPRIHTTRLKDRANRVLAEATIYTGGLYNRRRNAPSATRKQRAANIKWAVRKVRRSLRNDKEDPALRELLAQGLALNPKTHKMALSILTKLDSEAFLNSKRGYATLATLRAKVGDVEGSEQAQKRCAQLGGDSALCVPDAESKS